MLPRIDKLKKAFANDAEFERILALIYEDLIEFFQRTYKFFRRRAWAQWFEASWRLFEHRFSSIINKLAAHCETLDKQAAATHYAEMKAERERRRLEDAQYEKSRQQRMTGEVVSWLSSAAESQENYLHNLSDGRQPETCDWILADAEMQSWKEDDSGKPIVWMTGIPGAGKSVVCSFLVEHLQAQNSASILYYFCGQSSAAVTDNTLILRTFAVQCLRQQRDLASLVHEIYIGSGSNKSMKEMKSLLSKLLTSVGRTRILLDGLDEFELDMQTGIIKALLEVLSITQTSPGISCKILISSRRLPQIEKALSKNKQCISLDLGARPEESILLFIENSVADLKETFEEFDDDLFKKITVEFRAKAKGMFLWVRLVSEVLKSLSTQEDFEKALDKLPDGLDQAYGLILKRLNKMPAEARSRAFRILYWLCVAYIPVCTEDVADGVALKPGTMRLSKKSRSQNLKRDILDICAPIIEQSADNTLMLVHFTAKEYLLDIRSGHCRDIPSSPYLDIFQAHHDIAFACVANLIAALCFIPKYSGGLSEPDLHKIIVRGELGLQKYAHRFWARHVLDYLKFIPSGVSPEMELLKILDELACVRKNESPIDHDPLLQKVLVHVPEIRTLSSWSSVKDVLLKTLLLDAKRKDGGSVFQNYDAQKRWDLQEDLTFLSLVDSRVQKTTEELLSLEPDNLPSHIDHKEFHSFVNRFRFPCRILGCFQVFKGIALRDTHESTHSLTYQCPECDFSTRGFKSRRDLERHVERYHLSAEDFAVPETIHMESTSARGSQPNHLASGRRGSSVRLNERGQKVLEQGLRKALDNFSKQLVLQVVDAGDPTIASSAGGNDMSKASGNLPDDIGDIEDKINNHSYRCLRDFEDDLRPYLIIKSSNPSQVKRLCEQAFRGVLGAHPLFAMLDTEQPQLQSSGKSPTEDSELEISIGTSDPEGTKSPGGLQSIIEVANNYRPLYWSKIERDEFPALLQRFRLDFAGIADYLKTKTPEEVKIHFEQLTKANDIRIFPLLANLNNERENGRQIHGPCSEGEYEAETDAEIGTPYYWGQINPQPLAEAMIQNTEIAQIPTSTPHQEQRKQNDRPIIHKKIRKRPKVRCPSCKAILSNEHAWLRHMQSFHQRTRTYWVCRDNSADKKFLKGCRDCVGRRAYSTKQQAADHLRSHHSLRETNVKLLDLWIDKEEKLNRNFKEDEAADIIHEPENSILESSQSTEEQPGNPSLESWRLLPKLPEYPQTPYHDPLRSIRQPNHSEVPQHLDQDPSKAFCHLIQLPSYQQNHVEPSKQLPSLQECLQDLDQHESPEYRASQTQASSLEGSQGSSVELDVSFDKSSNDIVSDQANAAAEMPDVDADHLEHHEA